MSPDAGNFAGEPAGPVAYMANNGVAANLFLLSIVVIGLVSLTGLEREGWGVVPFNTIEVTMAYPGATPNEIEEAIVVKIEEQVAALEDVKSVRSVAAPGVASVRVVLKSGVDIAAALDDVESAVGRIGSFPVAAEHPEIREMTNRQSLMRLLVYGDVSERALKEIAYRIEDELASLSELSQVETTGSRNYEISVEVPLQRLRALGLTLDDVAAAVRRGSLELSAGNIETRDAEVRIRTLGRRFDQQDFEELIVLGATDGAELRLGDIAHVRDGFQASNVILRHQGAPAVFVEVYRSEGENVTRVAAAVHEHVANVIVPGLPEGVGIEIWNDESQDYTERMDILVKNGVLGLLLVFAALALFLEIRLALWVAVGLLAAGVGALTVMLLFDVPLHTVSVFAFVMAIGIVVDDAIVVAESIYQERQRGTPGVAAAIRGVRRIKTPLTFAVLTSVAAFSPLLFIPGGIGEIWGSLPIIVIGMLLISLVEAVFILPNHLSHLPGPEWAPAKPVDRLLAWTQGRVDHGLNRFIEGPLDRSVRFASRQPAVVLAAGVGALVVSASLLPAGIVRTTLAADVEGDLVTASLEMPDGTPLPRTYEVAQDLERAGRRAIERLARERAEDAPPLLSGTTLIVGQRPRVAGGGLNPAPTLNPEANVATIEFKLLSAQERDLSTRAVAQAWRDEAGHLPHVRGIAFSGDVIDLGNPVEVVLSHPHPENLAQIATSVVTSLQELAGVFDIRSDHAPGVREIQLELREEARSLGLTLEDLALQTRGAFFGAEALKLQRGRDEVRVYVRLPANERDAIADVEGYLIRTPSGAEVPLREVASLSTGTSPQSIRRRDGRRVVTVTADVDPAMISGGEVNDILTDTVLAELASIQPGLGYSFGGEQQEQVESLGALYRGFGIAMLFIFVMLAIPLRSYTKPLIVMAIIPFGLIGVILGHLVLGMAVSAVSFMGFFGLAGVVINDSLVMMDFIDQRLRRGDSVRTAIVEGAKGRFRPIALTSLTTFLGFTPLILDRAIQAQFLIPFAASIGIGILFTTVILMMVTPALAAIYLRANASGGTPETVDRASPAQAGG